MKIDDFYILFTFSELSTVSVNGYYQKKIFGHLTFLKTFQAGRF